jgi:hypothetical protein
LSKGFRKPSVHSQNNFQKPQAPILKGFPKAPGVAGFRKFLSKVSSGFYQPLIKKQADFGNSFVIARKTT